MDKASLEIKSFERSIEDNHIIFTLKIHNPLDRTAYGYAVVRRILYNSGTKKLMLCLHDQHVEDESPIGQHLREPKVKMFESKKDTNLNIKLKKVIKRLKAHSEPGTERIEVLNLDEAETIEFEIAHQDTPFYYNAKENNAAQLKNWAKPVCKKVFRIKRKDGGK